MKIFKLLLVVVCLPVIFYKLYYGKSFVMKDALIVITAILFGLYIGYELVNLITKLSKRHPEA